MGMSSKLPTDLALGHLLTRRRLLAGTGATLAVGGLTAVLARHGSFAQGVSQGLATPNALGSPVPPEVSQHATDCPVWQGDLTAHRTAGQSPIQASNVTKLQVAWTFPIKAAAAFGAMTSPPLIIGNTIYLQDNQSNVFALDRGSGKVLWETPYNVLQIGPGGIAVGYGLVYGSTGQRAEAFALEATTGKEV